MSSNDGSRFRSGSAEEPTAKRARTLTEADLGGPIEDEETAKQKLADAGFDPEGDLTATKFVECPDGVGHWTASPMNQFCAAGNLKMVRYLVSKGVPTVRDDTSPMEAASRMGQAHVCAWLFEHGASETVKSDAYVVGEHNLLRTALWPWKAGRGSNTPQWLILNGALSHPDGRPHEEAMQRIQSYRGAASDFRQLFSWVEETLQTNRNVHLILLGSLPPRDYSDSELHQSLSEMMKSAEAADFLINDLSDEKRRVLWKKLPPSRRASPLQSLCGKSGIFELIADFAGFLRGKHIMSTLNGIVGPLEKALGRAQLMDDTDDEDNTVQISYIVQGEN